MNNHFVLLTLVLMLVYLLGLWCGHYDERKKNLPRETVWSNRYWYTCDEECVPGVMFKIGVKRHEDLERVKLWHAEDYHGEDD